jgi:hypothetical protein
MTKGARQYGHNQEGAKMHEMSDKTWTKRSTYVGGVITT